MIEAAKVIVPIGEGKEVEARAIACGLQAFTEPYREDSIEHAYARHAIQLCIAKKESGDGTSHFCTTGYWSRKYR
jgi:hypothetical protein